MTEMMTAAENKILTVADYEARIHLYREQIGIGYIGIGRTLIEAKEAGVVPAGQWEAWVQDVTGLTVRQAQRCMQAAREIKDGSALARLEMSKAMRLLSSGLDEDQREELAAKASQDELTVRELEAEIRKLKASQEQAVELAREWEKRTREAFDEGLKAAERASNVEENLRMVQKDEEIRRLRQDIAKAQAAQDNMQENLQHQVDANSELALRVDEQRGQLHEAYQALRRAEEQLKRRQGADQEQYRIGKEAGKAELQDEIKTQNMRIRTLTEKQDALVTELAEYKRKDRERRMTEARGETAARTEDVLSRSIMDFLQLAGRYRPEDLKNDGALPGQLAALETWVGLTRMQLGVPVEGVVL